MQKELTNEGAGLLAAISGGESRGRYNVINGGKIFTDMSRHPFEGSTQATGYGVAAGKYQFMPATWGTVKSQAGLKDFSPASQDKGAWWLAQSDYARKTGGGDLQKDLEAGKQLKAMNVLSTTWTSLPGGAEKNNATAGALARYDAGKAKGVYGGGWANPYAAEAGMGTTTDEVASETGSSGDTGTTFEDMSSGNGLFVRVAVGLLGALLLAIGLVKMKF